jgi:hypothetical protein
MKSGKKKMKAVTLLTRIETMLSDVLDECSAIEKSVEKNARLLLRSAEASIAVAKEFFIAPEPVKARQKVAKVPKRVPRHRSATGATSAAAKRAVKTAMPLTEPPALTKRRPQVSSLAAPAASPSAPQASTSAL